MTESNAYTDAEVAAVTTTSIGAATTAQGALADSAVQPGDLAEVATSGAYGEIGGAQLAQGADVRVIGHTFTLALHRDSTSGLAVPGWVLSR